MCVCVLVCLFVTICDQSSTQSKQYHKHTEKIAVNWFRKMFSSKDMALFTDLSAFEKHCLLTAPIHVFSEKKSSLLLMLSMLN